MKKIEFHIQAGRIFGSRDIAYVDEEDDFCGQIVEQVVGDLSTEIEITVAGVTMHLAAWMDPDHWESDWSEVLGGESFDDYLARAASGGGA